ncbi:MAG: indolepyruvate ferredoxin oxidoreductase family protein [Hyphomicrobiales bacterium]|nr:indolepyruvate ferredoxin oxidoreductase family protein [Hyphomicrobiales bacterium]
MSAENTPTDLAKMSSGRTISLEDKYTATSGKVFMNGTQALVRFPIVQMRRDALAGFNTGTYISGYRGSPIGGYDFALHGAKKHLEEHDIVFQPGTNEDLAATAVWGSQQLNLSPGARKDGVVGIWYGKGPGVDRSGDVFKHGNSAGTSPNGGVLCIAGDDHTAKSSTTAHQSDHAFMAAIMPMLFPSSVQEFVELGLFGIAMSRYSGLWVGYKVISDTIETTGVVDLAGEQQRFVIPEDFEMPQGGLNLRWPDPILVQDERLQEHKAYAAIAFARANNIDQLIFDSKKPRFGIVASGKAYENVREALRQLGIDEKLVDKLGLRLYKVRMPWPLEPAGIREFAEGLEEVLVIEERREVIEHQIKQQLFNWQANTRPRIVGKFDHKDRHILKLNEEMTAGTALRAIASRLLTFDLPEGLAARVKQKLAYYEERAEIRINHEAPVSRIAHFCSGCPHNSSTKVPEGSRAMAGIGCHFLSVWMDRNTETFSHMGGEGAAWTGIAPFTDENHIFVNLGDGTYFHSGFLAIRQAVAAKVNITYKILFNDAVAMTGGQTHDGTLTPEIISHQIKAEGVKEIWLVSDEPEKYDKSDLPQNIHIQHRDYLEDVQKHLREVPGCTAIIYDQTCANEKRRRRKRGLLEDPKKWAFINSQICEGCGDCSDQSNCMSVEPLETEFGRKRQINQSSCNKDYSCVEGFCPSFVTVHGGALKKPSVHIPSSDSERPTLPIPKTKKLDEVFNIAITGVGGTGVLTIGAILGMAAHVDDKAAIILDMAGLAQKGGAVLSHVRLAPTTNLISSPQIVTGEADLLLAADSVVAAAQNSIALCSPENTVAIINTHLSPVSSFIFDRDFDFREKSIVDAIETSTTEGSVKIDFTKLAEITCGNTIATNIMIVGYAAQAGLLPISIDAIEQAIEINGVAVEANLTAFNWGRRFFAFPDEISDLLPSVDQIEPEPESETLETIIQKRAEFLSEYQDEKLAEHYLAIIAKVQKSDGDRDSRQALTDAVARNLFKLLSYKDEYEVARLYTNGEFEKRIADQFEGDYKINFHLAPPILGGKLLPNGRHKKRQYGPWAFRLFKILAGLKGLRGGRFDIFGYSNERKMERQLIVQYEGMIDEILPKLDNNNYDDAVALAAIPNSIRGFGPVKLKSVEKAAVTKSELLEKFRDEKPKSKIVKKVKAAE